MKLTSGVMRLASRYGYAGGRGQSSISGGFGHVHPCPHYHQGEAERGGRRETPGNARRHTVGHRLLGKSWWFLESRISLGLTIRKKGLETAVADGAICTSACALAWLGGSPRRMGQDARIGFHEPRDPSSGESSLKGEANIANYIRQLGLPYAALSFILRADPKSIAWLTDASSSAYRVFYVELRRDQAERYFGATNPS